MKQLSLYVVGVLVSLGIALVPLSASALHLSFGGRIIGPVPIPCVSIVGPALWFANTPAGGDGNPFHIWTVLTKGLPPLHIGQEILGLEDTPFWCCIPPGIPAAPGTCVIPPFVPFPGLLGLRVQLDGISP